jgi:hypothetical protein
VQESAPVLSKSCLQGVSGLHYKHKDPNRTNTILPRKVDCISCLRESEELPNHARHDREPKFKGANPYLPTLNFGASAKENKPIEFLQLMGEYMSIHFKPSICFAFWSSPPDFGPKEDEPVIPNEIPAGNPGKIVIAEYLSDHEWKSEMKNVEEHIKSAFGLTYGQLSESSRAEVQDDEDWVEAYNNRDLLFLIGRIRATHIARQSGNPGQDRERVQQAWFQLRQFSHETRSSNCLQEKSGRPPIRASLSWTSRDTRGRARYRNPQPLRHV